MLAEASQDVQSAAVDQFDLRTHNGIITITSNATGEHRTIKVWTQPEDAKFAAGKRLAGLLVGSSNETDYRAFGFVGDYARVFLFEKHRSSELYQWLKRFLENPGQFRDKVEINFEGRCRKCNRLLSDKLSVSLGIGPVCRGDQ